VICGLILAAGEGRRFGSGSKLLAELDGRPVLEHAIAAQTEVAELERIVVVLGARADEVRARVEFGRAQTVICEEWSAGQSASLRCGARELAGAERVIVTLGDVPTLSPAVIRRFLDAPARARAVYDGRPGHPVVLGSTELERLRLLEGDTGAAALLKGGLEIECSDLSSGLDVDTPDDLAALRSQDDP
jgi:molybdenum cofactor cytidylyltransferase